MLKDQSLIELALPGLTDQALKAEISAVGVELHYEDEDIILDQGMAIQYVPIVAEGTVRVTRLEDDGRELFLYFLVAGDSCASSLNCCMNKKNSEIQAVAEGEVRLLGIPQEKVDNWIMQFPEWKNLIINTFQRRFEDLLHSIELVAFSQLDERLVEYLRNTSEVLGTKILKTSHQEIANYLNSSREVISRLLKQLERMGKLKLARNTIQLESDF
jgi:CRP/FNR family transcriptional regulator